MEFLNKERTKELLSKMNAHNILFATTSELDYEMSRVIILEDIGQYRNYYVVNGSHCSCYGFDETEWDITEYTKVEIITLANTVWSKDNAVQSKELVAFINRYLKE